MKWFKNLFGNYNNEHKEEVNMEEDWDTFIPSKKNKQQTVSTTRGFKFPIISDEEFKKRTFIGSVSIYEEQITDDHYSSNFKESPSISQQEESPNNLHSPIINRRRIRRMTEEQPVIQTERVSRRSVRIREKVDSTITSPPFIKEPRTIRSTKTEQETVQHTPKPKAPFKLTEVPSPVFGFKERNVNLVNPNTVVEKTTKQESETTDVFTYLSKQRGSINDVENNSNLLKNDIDSINTLDSIKETGTQEQQLSKNAEEIREIGNSNHSSLTEQSNELNEEETVSINHLEKEQSLTEALSEELSFENQEVVQENSTFVIEKDENCEEEVEVVELVEETQEENAKPVIDTMETRKEEVEIVELVEETQEENAKPVLDAMETSEEEVEIVELVEETQEEISKPVLDTMETSEEEVEIVELVEEVQEEYAKPVFEYCDDCEEEIEVFEAVEETLEENVKPVIDTMETREEEVEVVELVEEVQEELAKPVLDTMEISEEEVEVVELVEEVQEELANPVFEYRDDCEGEIEVFEAVEETLEENVKPVIDTMETREEEVEVVEPVEEKQEENAKLVLDAMETREEEVEVVELVGEVQEEIAIPVFEYCDDCEEEIEVFEAVEETQEENAKLVLDAMETREEEVEVVELVEEVQEEIANPVFEYCDDCEEEIEVFEAVEETLEENEKSVIDTMETREEEVEVVELVEEVQEEIAKPVFEYCDDCEEEIEVFEAVEEVQEENAKPVIDTMETREEEVEVVEPVQETQEENAKPVLDAMETREEEVEIVELVEETQEEIVQQLMDAKEEVATTTIISTENESLEPDQSLITPRPKIRPFNVLMTKYDKIRWQEQQERESLATMSNQPTIQSELNNDLDLNEKSQVEEIPPNEEVSQSTLESDLVVQEETLSSSRPKIRPFNVLMTKYDKIRWQEQQERGKLATISNSSTIQTEINNQLQPMDESLISEEFSPVSLNTNTLEEEVLNEEINSSTAGIEEELPFYVFPSNGLLNDPVVYEENEQWLNEREEMLNATFASFNIGARVVHRTQGPSVTRFEVQLDPGVKVNKITNLSDDIQLGLAARDIRIEAPIPGKHTVGIEVPNDSSRPVRISEIINTPEFKGSASPLTSVLGLDIEGKPIVTDLKKMPHGLIAGATGSGKSVCINSILVSLLYKADPTDVKLILIDPKMVELAPYNHIPHLVSPVITDVKAATAALKWAVEEMERRYQLFAHTGVREIGRYNELVMDSKKYNQKLPYIVVVIDELADLMMVAASDVEDSICRIAQKARACGIHLIIATQRPSVDVITGLIKANVPTRIAFSVSSQVDSRTIIDISGAEKLLGKGDMLFLENGSNKAVRLQGTYVTDEEIEAVVTHCKNERQVEYLFQQEDLLKKLEVVEEEDELFLEACEFIIEHNAASASLLQRKFKIGYNRAARLIDMMESYGYISENRGSKPREVLISLSELKN